MRSVLVILFFLWASCLAFAQNNDTLKTKKYSITTSVFDYVSEFRSLNEITYNIEFAAPLKNRNFIHLSVGYTKSYNISKVFLSAFTVNDINPQTKGFKASIEGRHYLGKHKLFEPAAILFWLNVFQYKSLKQNNTGYYVAFHSKYHYSETKSQETIFYSEPSFYTKDIDIIHSRNIIGSYFKFGYNAIKRSGFTVDHAIGLGAAFVSNLSDENQVTNPHYYHPYSSGQKVRFDLTYTFKVGWSF